MHSKARRQDNGGDPRNGGSLRSCQECGDKRQSVEERDI